MVWFQDYRAKHVAVTPRLVHQRGADGVVGLLQLTALLGHSASQEWDTGHHDPSWLPGGVCVNGMEYVLVHSVPPFVMLSRHLCQEVRDTGIRVE
jgi:hypothetical protein